MKSTSLVALLVVCVLIPSATTAETKCRGWRGDGTGLFPEADPPVNWSRISTTLKGLHAQAEKPRGNGPGQAKPVRLGHVDDWLIIGPFDDGGKDLKDVLDEAFIPDEANVQPDAGDRAGAVAWRKVQANGSMLDFLRFHNDLKGKAVYAHTYIHSAAGGEVSLWMKSLACRIWLNGEELCRRDKEASTRIVKTVTLRKGWNRLLVKTVAARRKDTWAVIPHAATGTTFFQVILFGLDADDAFETTGLLWSAPIAQAGRFSCAQPIVVGDRVYVNADPTFLVCYDKLTGKRLWVRYCGFSACATPAERAANAEAFAQINADVKRVETLATTYAGTLAERIELNRLCRDIDSRMSKVDRKRYARVAKRQEAGTSGLCSATDGEFIYTWFANGVAVCHDLDGNRRWLTLENQGAAKFSGGDGHGYQVSPMLTDSEFVVWMRSITAFDKTTGRVLWRIPRDLDWPPKKPGVPVTAEGVDRVHYPGIALYVPGKGFFPWSRSTHVDGLAYITSCEGAEVSGMLAVYSLPQKMDDPERLKKRWVHASRATTGETVRTPGVNWGWERCVANALVHDGLIYTISMGGVLRVIDAETLKPVYTRRLGLNTITWAYPYPHGSGVCASPTLGGKYIYLWGNGGTTFVIKPGRTFEVVATNRIERLLCGHFMGGMAHASKKGHYAECTVSSPVFDGKRIYYQGERYLYCIGER